MECASAVIVWCNTMVTEIARLVKGSGYVRTEIIVAKNEPSRSVVSGSRCPCLIPDVYALITLVMEVHAVICVRDWFLFIFMYLFNCFLLSLRRHFFSIP